MLLAGGEIPELVVIFVWIYYCKTDKRLIVIVGGKVK